MYAFMFGAGPVSAGDHNPKSIIPLLKDSKASLIEAINYAEKTSGPATSAKYEVETTSKATPDAPLISGRLWSEICGRGHLSRQ